MAGSIDLRPFSRSCCLLFGVLIGTAVSPALAGRINDADRRTFEEFRSEERISKEDFNHRFGGAARIECDWDDDSVRGSAAIVHQRHIFVTADHVFVDDSGELRGPKSKCTIETLADGRKYKIRPGSVVHGFLESRGNDRGANTDWAVGRLTEPTEVRPFEISKPSVFIKTGTPVILMTQGHDGWGSKRPSIGRCSVISNLGNSFVTTDCDADKGASGGPLLLPPTKPDGYPMFIGVLVSTLERLDKSKTAALGSHSASIVKIGRRAFYDRIVSSAIPGPGRKPKEAARIAELETRLQARPGDPTTLANLALARIALGASEFREADLDADRLRTVAIDTVLLDTAIQMLSTEIKADASLLPAIRLRARLFQIKGESARAKWELTRYNNAVREIAPALSEDQWVKIVALWKSSGERHYFAVARPDETAAKNHAITRAGSPWEAGINAKRICEYQQSKPCRIYALGDVVVWSLTEPKLEAAYQDYVLKVRRRREARLEELLGDDGAGSQETRAALAETYFRLGRIHDAARHWRQLLQGDAGQPEIRVRLAQAEMMLGNYQAAADSLSPLILRPSAALSGDIAEVRAQANIALGRFKVASADAEWLIRQSDGFKSGGYILRGGIQLARGEIKKAVATFRTAQSLQHGDPVALVNICRALLAYGQPAAAHAYCRDANWMRPKNPEILDLLARARWQSGDREGAVALLKQVVAIRPSAVQPPERLHQFAIELAARFLRVPQLYSDGQTSKVSAVLRTTVEQARRTKDLPEGGLIDEALLGELTHLGFGRNRLDGGEGGPTAATIRSRCKRVETGARIEFTPAGGIKYRCNADGLSVRRVGVSDR